MNAFKLRALNIPLLAESLAQFRDSHCKYCPQATRWSLLGMRDMRMSKTSWSTMLC